MKVTQSTLYEPMDYTVHGILQVRILEWVAFPFSRGSFQSRDWTQVSRTAGGFFTSWATREAPIESHELVKGLPRWHSGKESACQCRRPWFDSWVGKIPWRRDRLPTPVFLGFLCGTTDKESACNVGGLGSIPGLGRSPGKRKATQSSILAWRIPWTV